MQRKMTKKKNSQMLNKRQDLFGQANEDLRKDLCPSMDGAKERD
jgi:hypothetical protein